MTMLIAGLLIFLGIHSVKIVAPEWREARIAAMGANAWKIVYSILSIGSFVLLLYGYSAARAGAEILYQPLTGMYPATVVLMTIALILMMVFILGPGHLKQKTRHPFLLAIILWSIAHLWMNGDTASVVMFGAFLVWSAIDLASALKRPEGEKAEPKIAYDILAIVSGIAIAGLLVWKLHLSLFGVAPIV